MTRLPFAVATYVGWILLSGPHAFSQSDSRPQSPPGPFKAWTAQPSGVSLRKALATERAAESPAKSLPQIAEGNAAQFTWRELVSVGKESLQIAELQGGETRVLVIGPLDGTVTEPLRLLETLLEQLQSKGTKSPPSIAIINDPNPTGRAHRTLANEQGVLLDTNFPAKNWRRLGTDPRVTSGPVAASEPEVRAIADYIRENRPSVIYLLALDSRRVIVEYTKNAAQEANRLAAELRAPLSQHQGSIRPGSLAEFAGTDLGIPVITLRLPREGRFDARRSPVLQGLLQAISNYGGLAIEPPPAKKQDEQDLDPFARRELLRKATSHSTRKSGQRESEQPTYPMTSPDADQEQPPIRSDSATTGTAPHTIGVSAAKVHGQAIDASQQNTSDAADMAAQHVEDIGSTTSTKSKTPKRMVPVVRGGSAAGYRPVEMPASASPVEKPKAGKVEMLPSVDDGQEVTPATSPSPAPSPERVVNDKGPIRDGLARTGKITLLRGRSSD